MRRRAFIWLGLFAVLAFAPPSPAQFLIISGGGAGSGSPEGGGGDGTNFAARCAAYGVVVCIDFDSSLTEDGGQYYDSATNGTRGFRDTTVYAEGGGSLRFDLEGGETGVDISGQWTDMSAPYLLGAGFGEGDTFYAQVRIRISPEMLTNIPEWDDASWKVLLFHKDTASCGAMELTTVNRPGYNDINAYWHCSPGLNTEVDSPIYAPPSYPDDPLTQQAWDLSSGPSYVEELGSANVQYPNVGVAYATNEQMTLDYKVSIGTLYADGTGQPADSTFEMWVTFEDGTRKKIKAVQLALEYNGADTDTFNNITLTPYMTGLATSAAADAHIWYDSLIVSSMPIAPPNSNAVPSWVTDATDNTWTDVPGTDTGDLTATGMTNPTAALTAWTGFSYDSDKQWIIAAAVGGHNDRSDNDVMVLDVSVESPAWVQFVGPSASAANTDAQNGTGARGDGSRATDHNVNLPVYAEGRVWFPGFCCMSGATGNSSTAVWSWNDDDIANGELGYEYFGIAAPCCGVDGVSLVFSGADYDPVTRRVWQIKQNWAGSEALVSVSAGSGDTTAYVPSGSSGNCIQSVVINPRKRTALMLPSDECGSPLNMVRMNLDSPGTMTTVTSSGCSAITAVLAKGSGAVFSQESNGGHGAALVYTNGAQDFIKVAWPTGSEDGTGTYTCSTADMSGTAPSSITNGVWKKVGLITYPDGTEVIFVTDSVTGPVKFLKLPDGGVGVLDLKPALDYLVPANDEVFDAWRLAA